MIGRWLNGREVWLYQPIIDFRKQMDGLIQVVASEMERRPTDGSFYLFRNRKKDKLKVVFWDRNGFWMGYKRLEKGHFDFPKDQVGKVSLSLEQLYLLISGLPMTKLNYFETEKGMSFF